MEAHVWGPGLIVPLFVKQLIKGCGLKYKHKPGRVNLVQAPHPVAQEKVNVHMILIVLEIGLNVRQHVLKYMTLQYQYQGPVKHVKL